MSNRFVSVQWTRPKIVYDLILLACVGLWIGLFPVFAKGWGGAPQILKMRTWGTCAFLMITFILAIGPLARLDRRWLPVLYNRRHFGVLFFFVALGHGKAVIDYYHAWGIFGGDTLDKVASALAHDTGVSAGVLPFPLFGIVALGWFLVMAVTSHDFWQKLLGPIVWKSIHMGVYGAYGAVVLHVAYGALRDTAGWGVTAFVLASAAGVVGLHLLAAIRSAKPDREAPRWVDEDGERWLDAGDPWAIPEDRARPLPVPDGERIALVRWNGRVSAVHGVCAHQGGPLYEGKVIDGALTCPWHHWTYRPEDGQSPPPFTEKLPTYRVRLDRGGRRLLVDSRPLPPGTATPPAVLDPSTRPVPAAPGGSAGSVLPLVDGTASRGGADGGDPGEGGVVR
jgi:nitrite reductase/ring-hydroxylating ferredoxin subunit/DMSO/TMAO reductase YedYZ heme-binding membrane subunit